MVRRWANTSMAAFLRGVKTGLNKAFVIDEARREALD